MFGRIRSRVLKTKDELKAGYEKRKAVSATIWQGFVSAISETRKRKLVTVEMSLSDAVRGWGFGSGEIGYRRAKTASLFMCVVFLAIFFWCAFYFVRSIVLHQNYISAFGSFVGMVTGIVVGVVNLWRWQVLCRRKYVPFPSWIRRGGMI